ncbi:MAG: FtsQ-type POTRA domain-containing protein [bacterium]|nr:FtsQ-type POTRA domain-containing protein [bacterium]
MAKKRTAQRRTSWLTWALMKRAALAVALATALVVALIALQMIEDFLIADERFTLHIPEVAGDLSPSIDLRGVEYASGSGIREIFAEDGGRSLYEFPVEQRREQLLGMDWIRRASVSRIWPNRVEVTVTERAPVAYAQLFGKRRGPPRLVLIDADGVLLAKPPRSQFSFPILTGMRKDQDQQTRARRVRLATRMLAEIGELESGISEIEVADTDNLVVTQDVSNRSVVLHLGRERFLERLTNFLNHYPQIRRKQPRSKTFDLRIDDRITALDGVEADG